MAEAAKVIETPAYRIKESQMQRFEFSNTQWDVGVDPHVTPDDVKRPEFWANVSRPKNMKIGDICRVRPHDRSWTAFVEVLDCGPNWAKVDLYQLADRRGQEPLADGEAPKGFSVTWQGPVNRFVVMRDSDKAVISKGHKDKAEAQIALIEHARTAG
jgi:hypothetical protein